VNDDDERVKKDERVQKNVFAADARRAGLNPVVSNPWCSWLLWVQSRIFGLFVPGMVSGMSKVYAGILPTQCNAPVMLLRKLNVIFVVTLCSGSSAYAIRPRIDEPASR